MLIFDNEHVTAEKIQETHFKTTMMRKANYSVVLTPQDTTVLNFSTQYQRTATGPTKKEAAKV